MSSKQAIVSPEWLYEHLNDEYILILDASFYPPETNLSTQDCLPGSRFFDIRQRFSDLQSGLPNTLPSTEAFTSAAQKLGVNQNHRIVVYDQKGLFSAARAWWLFKVMGHAEVYLLNGGLPHWQAKGYPTVSGHQEAHNQGNFQAQLQSEYIADQSYIQSVLSSQAHLILDQRAPERFKGQAPEPREGLRSGHIPHSKNLPYGQLLEEGCYRDKKALQTTFDECLATPEQELIFSCGSGVTACIAFLAAYELGYPKLKVYDGSWTEWGAATNTTKVEP